jgi:hypothetical protein
MATKKARRKAAKSRGAKAAKTAKAKASKAKAKKPKAAKAKAKVKKPKAAKAKASKEKTSAVAGTRSNPWKLKTPSGQSAFEAFCDETLDPPALVVQVGKTELRYHLRCLTDLQAMLKEHGDWMLLGSADEQKPAADGTVEAWARSASNPVGGFYGLKKGLRGRFAMYVPPVMKAMNRAEVENNPKNNRMRAL